MIRIANLNIDPKAVEALPESLAVEHCVLPIGFDGELLRVVFGRRVDYRESSDKIEFVIDRKIVRFVSDPERIEKAIDEGYHLLWTEVKNCPLDFQFECPKRWLELQPTADETVRFCELCQREVYLPSTRTKPSNRHGQVIASRSLLRTSQTIRC